MSKADLAKVVEVVLPVDPSVGRPFVEAICFVFNLMNIWTLTIVESAFEKLQRRNAGYMPHDMKKKKLGKLLGQTLECS